MSRTLFLVRKAVVYAQCDGYGDGEGPALRDVVQCCNGIKRTAPVGLFATREEAENEARRLDAEARATLNPWWLRSCRWQLADLTPAGAAPTPADLGVEIPPPVTVESEYGPYESTANQVRWNDERWPELSAEQRDAVWREVLGNVGFFTVAEVAFED
jgi:hypothetical protein